MKPLIIATRNQHKFEEISSFFQSDGHPQTLSLKDLRVSITPPEVEEDCLSFVGNALKKAKTISQFTKQAVLADDSGLIVPALQGRPGVFSARYAGKGSTDDQNNQKLLQELKNISSTQRQAFFVCAMVLYLENGTFYTSLGTINGTIIDDRRGKHGFGYDPIFYMSNRKCTLAEVPQEEKIKFSHRTKALEKIRKWLIP